MEKESETVKSSEQILEEKREKLKKSLYLMLDWQMSEKIKKGLSPILKDLTSEELDYCSLLVHYIDTKTQLRGPLVSIAREQLGGEEETLEETERKIGKERMEELRNLITGI